MDAVSLMTRVDFLNVVSTHLEFNLPADIDWEPLFFLCFFSAVIMQIRGNQSQPLILSSGLLPSMFCVRAA